MDATVVGSPSGGRLRLFGAQKGAPACLEIEGTPKGLPSPIEGVGCVWAGTEVNCEWAYIYSYSQPGM